MYAIEVTRADTGAVVGWVCSKCGHLYDRRSGGDHEREYAVKCCVCESCGVVLEVYGSECSACRRKNSEQRQAAAEAARFAKAQKVSWQAYGDGYVFTEATRSGQGGEGFFHSPGELADHFRGEGEPVPAYCWATEPHPMRLDADTLVDNALEEHFEGAADQIDQTEMVKLQAFLTTWAEENDPGGYTVDYDRAVLLEGIGGDRG